MTINILKTIFLIDLKNDYIFDALELFTTHILKFFSVLKTHVKISP